MNLFTADIGEGRLHVYDSGNDTFYGKLPKDDIIALNIPELQSGDTLVVECAHLREAHERTMAQAYIFDKLKELKQNADKLGIIVKLFPQKSTPKARKLYRGVNKETEEEFHGFEVDKDETAKFIKTYAMSPDEADTRSIAQFLLNDQNAFHSLKTFIPTKMKDFQNKSQHIFDYIQEANDDINPAKSSGYGLDPKKPWYEDEVSKWIKKYTVDGGSSIFGYTPTIVDYLEKQYPNDYEELAKVLGLSIDKKSGKIKIENENRIYTLTTTILRRNGSLRYREDNGKVPYWKYVKAHLLGCKPYHMNQGVIASNYKHWMRRAVSEYAFPGKKSALTSDFQVGMSYDEYFKLKEARTKVDKMTQKIWYVLREMIVEDGLR
tara:strand:+ start:134 stop:1267 length:1134 start_codon:yes stop_codon:yes gene_type:complete